MTARLERTSGRPDEELARRLRRIWGATPSGNGEGEDGA
jgi:hypothetical protein